MKFRRLSLRPYGAVQSMDLEFQGDFGLHLVFGTNGAGKSTTLSALRASLFGMKPGEYSFLTESNRLRIGADLVHSDGRTIEFTRRTSPKSPIWNAADDEPLAEELLSPFLGGLDAQRFRTLFGLDLDEMVAGGKDLLSGKGEIGRALFGAGLGGKRLATVTKRLEDELGRLHTPGNSKARINELSKEYKALEKDRNAAALAASAYDGDKKLLKELRAESAEADARRKALRTEAQTLGRLARAADALAALEAKEQERETHGAGAPLEQETERRALELGREREELGRKAEERRKRVQTLVERRLGLERKAVPALLGAAAQIDKLLEGLGGFQIAAKEAAEARREMDEARGGREKALLEAGVESDSAGAGLPATDSKINSETGNDAVQAEDATGEALAAAADRHLSKLQAAEMERDACTKEAGRAAHHMERLRTELTGLEEGLAVKLGPDLLELAPFSGDLAGLAKLAVPGAETIEAHDEEHRAIEAERSALDARRTEAERVLTDARSAAEAFLQSSKGGPPAWEELQAMREQRDAELAAALDERVSGEALERSRALGLERLMRTSDEAADRRAAESEMVAAQRSRLLDVERAEEELGKLGEAESALDGRVKSLRVDCEGAWAGLGGPLMDPPAMTAWAGRRKQVLTRADEARLAARESLAAAEAAHGERAADLGAALERLTEVEAAWVTWAKKHRLDPEAGPSEAQRRLRVLKNVRAADRQLARSEHVYKSKSADEARFKADVQELADGLGVRVDEQALEAALGSEDESTALTTARMKRLVSEKEVAQRAETELQAIKKDLVLLGKEQALDEARGEQVLTELVQLSTQELGPGSAGKEAPKEPLEELLVRAAASEQLRSIAADIARLDEQFAEHADDKGRTEIREALGDRGSASLHGEAEGLLSQADVIDDEQSQRIHRMGELSAIVEGDGSDVAAGLEARLAEIEAEIEECAQSYLEVRVAEVLLNREVARYREQTQGPILARAQELFEILTLGAYVQLHPSMNSRGEEVMVARRPDGTTVEVKGMSTGTRDQLYLALRIASVEHMLENVEPMPFIADDLFVNFDDERTEAALKVLAELSKSTQVIVFSHHESVVETALRLTSEGVPVDVVRLTGEAQRENERASQAAQPSP